jgi:hypothetical protein
MNEDKETCYVYRLYADMLVPLMLSWLDLLDAQRNEPDNHGQQERALSQVILDDDIVAQLPQCLASRVHPTSLLIALEELRTHHDKSTNKMTPDLLSTLPDELAFKFVGAGLSSRTFWIPHVYGGRNTSGEDMIGSNEGFDALDTDTEPDCGQRLVDYLEPVTVKIDGKVRHLTSLEFSLSSTLYSKMVQVIAMPNGQ